MKLKIELVPETAWYSNLRNKIPKNEWDKIRKQVYSNANYKCEICANANIRLNCHEIWEYDDERYIQKLKGFIALCDNCHNIKHMGFVNVQISKGIWPKEKLNDLAKHFMEVNNVNLNEFNQHVDNAFNVWKERSKYKWKTDLSKWSYLISKDNPNPGQKTLF